MLTKRRPTGEALRRSVRPSTTARWAVMFGLLFCAAFQSSRAGTAHGTDAEAAQDAASTSEPERRWSLHIDNDLFAFTRDDRDYTGGAAFTLTGDDVRRYRWSSSAALTWLDDKLGVGALLGPGASKTPALQLGLLLFTPQDLAAREPVRDDRPYASLFYLSSSELARHPNGNTAFQSTLTVGFLGLPLAADIHRGVHSLFHDIEPMGYAHQISAGGEPTFRFALSRYRLLSSGAALGRRYALRFDTEASVGYLTEGNAELAIRWGNTDAPWWSSSSESGDYAGQPVITGRTRSERPSKMTFQFSAGAKLRARLYDSFLQGQFRDSDVAYPASQVNRLILEGWVGVDVVLKNDIAITYILRRQTPELEVGRGARAFTWADLSIAQRF